MKQKLSLMDFPINIDTISFKFKAEVKETIYKSWEDKYFYFQIFRYFDNCNISFRYYPQYTCLSVHISSLPAFLYGSSQIKYCSDDYITFKNDIIDIIEELTDYKPNDFEFNSAVLTRIDLNQDYYFTNKKDEEKFREWLALFSMPYGREYQYDSGGKMTTNSKNITFYSKDEQCKDKKITYLNEYGDFCTRIEFQIKSTYLRKHKNIFLCELLADENFTKKLYLKNLSDMKMSGSLINRRRFYYIIEKETKIKHREGFVSSRKEFFFKLSKNGVDYMLMNCKSFYHYIGFLTNKGISPIMLNDAVYKSLQEYYQKLNS